MHLAAGPIKPEAGVIMKLFDFYKCNKEIQGTWYLMRGPDLRGNCLLSFNFMQPHKEKANLGWTQYQYSDFRKLNTSLHGAII